MKQTAVLAACMVLGMAGAAAAQGGPPQPTPEHKQLAYWAGSWSFSGEAKASPIGPGGPMSFTETCRLMEGGFTVVCQSKGTGPMGPTEATAIMSYDAAHKVYRYIMAESKLPLIMATGTVKGPAWTWTTEENVGGAVMKTRVVTEQKGPKQYTFRMEIAMGDGPYTLVSEGTATRTSS